jgi:hypothetical protein
MTSKPEVDNLQQKLMRHADIRTTMNIYGDAATEGHEACAFEGCADGFARSLLNGSLNESHEG